MNDNSLFAIGMDFAHRYVKMRRIVYVYIYFLYKIEGGENLSIKMFNEKFVILIFKWGQSISLRSRFLSVVVDGVQQAITGGSLRHSPGQKNGYSSLNTINERNFFISVLVLSHLVELSG